MRKIYQPKRFLRMVFLLLCTGFMSSAFAQLSGTYTIDNTQATAGTNYQTWLAFRNAITTSGVSGPVTVNVMTDETGTGQIDFPQITGTSSTNTVTINGNGKYLQFGIANAVILFSGADYFTISNLIIRNTSTSQYVQGVRLYNQSNYNTITGCTIEFTALTTGTTAGGAYVAFSSSSTSMTSTSSTDHGIYCTISNNLMRTTNTNSPGPAYGITCTGNISTYSYAAQNNTISGNTIQNFYYMGVYMYYTNGNQVLNNDISRVNSSIYNCSSTLYGIQSYYSYAAARPTKIDGNTLHDWPFVGATTSSAPSSIYAFYTYYNYGTATYRFSMSNNNILRMRAVSYMYLGYNFYNQYFDLVGNTATDDDVTISTSSAYQFYGWYNGYSYYSYRFNSNTIQNCDGGYYWYGIRNDYPQTALGVQEINDNLIQNNTQAYYYAYRIYTYYAQYSNATYPINMLRNRILNNQTNYYYTYNIYSYYYGTYNIEDNIIDGNISNYYYMYNMYLYYYGNYRVARNIIKNNKAVVGNVGYVYGIYSYYNYDNEIVSNLIVENAGYYGQYGIYAYYGSTINAKADIRQNTVKINGSLSSYTSQSTYPLYALLYYHPVLNVIGNIFETTNVAYSYFYVYNYNSINVNHNSYYWSNVLYPYFYTLSNGSATSVPGWIGLGLGNAERNLSSGHNFATNWASNRFLNQNNVPASANNLKDVYGVVRNPAKSDRGAVEGVLDIAQTNNNFNPPSPVCAGYTVSPQITFQNNFAEPVTGFTVAMSDNGVVKYLSTYTSTIAINGTGVMTFPAITFSQAGQHTVKFFLKDADDVPSNDTTSFTFNVLKSPGGGVLSQNTSLSSPAAMYLTTGKPDITFPNEKMVYDLTAPATVGYTNNDYGVSKSWIGSVTAKTVNGFVANSTVSTNNAAPFKVTVDAPKAWEDSTIVVSINIHDMISGCDTVYTRKVFIAPKAVPSAKFPTALCEKTDLIFESTSTVSSGSIDYDWDFGDGTAHSIEASPAHKYANFGQYTVVLKTTTNPYAFTTTKTFVIDVTEVPVATIINTNNCEGIAVKLKNATVYGGSGTITYDWNYGDGTTNSTTSKADIFKNYSTPGGYKVTLTATADGCINTTTKVVYQFAKPVADFAQTSGNCLNTEFNFDNKSTITIGQFGNLWDFDDAGNQATVESPAYTFQTAGTKNVKLQVVSEFGCTDSKTIPVLVKQTPTTDYSFPFACSRSATNFTNLTNLNGETLQSYYWNFGDAYTSTAPNPTKNWINIGPRIVSLTTYLLNGCSTTASKTIDVGVQPNVEFSVEDRCAGSEVPFANQTTYAQGNITYTWNFGDGNYSSLSAPVHAYNSSISQTYTVQLKASIAGGCSDSISHTVTINPLPTTCNFDITGNNNAARNTKMVFTPTGGSTTGITYTWLTGDGNTVNSNGTGTSYNYSAPGKYCVTMIASNAAGCECSTTKCVTMTTDITDAESMNNAVSVYPNPNSGLFNVSLSAEINSDMTVKVFNTLGELVKTVVVNNNATEVNMTDCAAGVYMVKVYAENQVATKKITITK